MLQYIVADKIQQYGQRGNCFFGRGLIQDTEDEAFVKRA